MKNNLKEVIKELNKIDSYAFGMNPEKITWEYKIEKKKIVCVDKQKSP